MRSWNSPGSHTFGCQDASGILGNFLDIYLLGIIIGIQNQPTRSACVFSLSNFFLNYEDVVNTVAFLKVSIDVNFKEQVKECGPVLECIPHAPSFAISFHLCILIPVSQPRGIIRAPG